VNGSPHLDARQRDDFVCGNDLVTVNQHGRNYFTCLRLVGTARDRSR
jgi:hypothetical protein